MPRSYQVTPAGPDQPVIGKTHARQPEGDSEPKSQTTSSQDPNHRNSGTITLTLTATLASTTDSRATDQ
jgi:hypothetical protein